jgi:hypothetical protein
MRRVTRRPERLTNSSATIAEVARHHGEQIARLRERVLPDGEVPADRPRCPSRRDCRSTAAPAPRLAGLDAHPIAREHVGAVGEVGDAAEAFSLALGAVDAVGAVKPGQRLVVLGIAARRDLQHEGPLRHMRNRKPRLAEFIVARRQRFPVELHLQQLEMLAVEPERRAGGTCLGVRPELEAAGDDRLVRLEPDVEADPVDEPGGGR